MDGCVIEFLCSPSGPGTPFAPGWMILWDSLRVLLVVGSLAIIARSTQLYIEARRQRQAERFLALALFALVCLTTELSKLGNDPSYRLAINLVAVLAGLSGCFRHGSRLLRHRGERHRGERGS